MDWVLLSFVSATLLTANSLLQRYVMQRELSGVLAFGFWGAMVHLAVAVGLLVLQPLPETLQLRPVLAMAAVGLLTVFITILICSAVRREEVTRAVPILDSCPIFIAIMAVAFLGEAISAVQWVAICMVVAGAFLASMHQQPVRGRFRVGLPFFLLLSASFGIAVHSIVSKYVLGYMSFQHAYAVAYLAAAPAFAVVIHASRAWPQVRQAAQVPRTFALVLAAGACLSLAIFSALWAFQLGPVSLASAIMAIRPVMVLAYAGLIAYLAPRVLMERNSRSALAAKGLSATFVTAGVGALALT